MSRMAPSPSQLAVLADYWRAFPAPSRPRDFRDAGSVAGLTEACARRAWSRGWPGIEPIEVQLATERAVVSTSVEVLRAEHLAQSASDGAAALLTEVRRLQPVVVALVDSLVARIESGDFVAMEPTAALGQLAKVGRIAREVVATVRDAVELRRLVDGEATSIIGHVPTTEPDLETARAEVEATMRAIRRAEGTRQLMSRDDDGTVH